MFALQDTVKYKGDDGYILDAVVIAVGSIETSDKDTAYYNCVTPEGDIITLREDQALRCDVLIEAPVFSIGMKVAYTDYEEDRLMAATITDIKIELSLGKDKDYETLTTYILDNGAEVFDDEILSIK